MKIRPAETEDHAGIDRLLRTAFPEPAEAALVLALRAADADSLELVAEAHGEIIGQILFSPVEVDLAAGNQTFGLGLAPLAVAEAQRQKGIGAALVQAGVEFVKTLGVPFCAVLGDPEYYGRFGFQPASNVGWRWNRDPDGAYAAAFQILILSEPPPTAQTGQLAYHPAFDLV
jgi:putative acetyltransferase